MATNNSSPHRLLACALALVAALIFALPAYSAEYSDSVDWKRFEGKNISINVFNWGEYIAVDDGEDGSFDVNAAFEELTGIRVN